MERPAAAVSAPEYYWCHFGRSDASLLCVHESGRDVLTPPTESRGAAGREVPG